MQLAASMSLTKLSVIIVFLAFGLLIVKDLIVVFLLKRSFLSEIRQSAKKLEVDEQFSNLNEDLGNLGKTVQGLQNKMADLDFNRRSLTFTYEPNITDLLLAENSMIESKAKLFSETFYLRGLPFYLVLGTFRTNVSYLSLFLKSQIASVDADRPFALQYELSILSHSGNAGEANKTVKGEFEFAGLPYVRGWLEFVTFAELMERGLVKKNAIKLRATLKTNPV